ncbi:MAG: histidine phosphatase family protein [Planctomycetota bacterium]
MASDPPPSRLVLVRHGRVAEAWRGRLYGDRDVPLSPRGEEEARATARLLAAEAFAAVVSSGLARAEFGAAELRRGRALPRRDEPALREIRRGEWGGLLPAEVPGGAFARWLARPDRERPPGGESLADLASRVLPRLDEMAAELAGGAAALVSHLWVIRVAAAHALGLALARAGSLAVPFGGIVALDWAPGHVVLAAFAAPRLPPRAGRWYRGPAPRPPA